MPPPSISPQGSSGAAPVARRTPGEDEEAQTTGNQEKLSGEDT